MAVKLCVGTYGWAQKAHIEGLIASGWRLLYSPKIPKGLAEHVHIAGELSFVINVCKNRQQECKTQNANV
jgi:hypothetical protein